MSQSDAFYRSAIYYNAQNAAELPTFTDVAVDTPEFVDVVVTFQTAHGMTVDGKLGPLTATAFRQELMDGGETIFLDFPELTDIAAVISEFEGDFDSMNRDGEFRGLFDRPSRNKWHWASKNNPNKKHGIHLGLSYGFIQFTQDSGQLGKLLQRMYDKNPPEFKRVFGVLYQELLEVTNLPGKTRKWSAFGEEGLRSPRVQPVGGADLWDSPKWSAAFKEAATVADFRRAQLELAVDDYMIPALRICEDLGLCSERAIAYAFDRCVHYGPAGARKHLFTHTRRRPKEEEHAYLLRFMRKYESRRWGHRLVKLWRHRSFWDGPCDWSAVQ